MHLWLLWSLACRPETSDTPGLASDSGTDGTNSAGTDSASTTDDTGLRDLRTDPGEPPADGFQLKTPEFEIPAYTEVSMCYYGTYTGETVGVYYYEWFQDINFGHHFTMHVARSDDAHPDGTFIACNDPVEGRMESMEPLFQGTEAVSKLNGKMVLPEGKAVRLQQGQRWVMQSHYLNTGSRPILVQDSANLRLVPADQVDAWVASYAFNDSQFVLPPGYSEVQVECTWPVGVNVMTMMGHMHDHGLSISVDLVRGGEERRVYELPVWDPGWVYEPQVWSFADGELVVEEGDVFRLHCAFDNTSGGDLTFPSEMCVTSGMAWPLDATISCDHGAIMGQ